MLNNADETTCGQHIRKDLGFERAQEVSRVHSKHFDNRIIVRVLGGEHLARDFSSSLQDEERLRRDEVADAVIDFGVLDTTISSLAQLKPMHTARSVIAMTSLGRAYVRNCRIRGGSWTSGINLYWWNKNRLDQIPELLVDDIRYTGATSLKRQADLAIWSVMMLRLCFIDDIVEAAFVENDEIGLERGITDRAATAVQDFDLRKLGVWIRRELLPSLAARLNNDRYRSIVGELKRKSEDGFILPGEEINK
ncbi:hypothetical protein [Sphingomonas panacis]|uniref:hypothetical protein n=1 Tax=Sphingomonas panacis TaxID=1560345 RepID=UPI0012374748|nr:hypothetical protein [Sphingomonas panacis]